MIQLGSPNSISGGVDCGAMILVTAYGCGPNIVVGVPATVFFTGKGILKIAKACLAQRQVDNERTDLLPLNRRVTQLKADALYQFKIAGCWALSTIPLVGPWLGLLCLSPQEKE